MDKLNVNNLTVSPNVRQDTPLRRKILRLYRMMDKLNVTGVWDYGSYW